MKTVLRMLTKTLNVLWVLFKVAFAIAALLYCGYVVFIAIAAMIKGYQMGFPIYSRRIWGNPAWPNVLLFAGSVFVVLMFGYMIIETLRHFLFGKRKEDDDMEMELQRADIEGW